MNAPRWPSGRIPNQTEYVDTVLAAALSLHTSGIKSSHRGIASVRTWANYPTEHFHRYVLEQSRGCSMRMQAMSRTAPWYDIQRQFFFWRFLLATCLCWKFGRADLIPSVTGLHDAMPFVTVDFSAWLRDEGARMLSGAGVLLKEHIG